MDNEEITIIYAMIFMFSLLVLLFTSYNFPHNIPILITIYGLMIIVGLSAYHALDSAIGPLDNTSRFKNK